MRPEIDCVVPIRSEVGERLNDGITDPEGRLWAGTMKDGIPRERLGRFYRLDLDKGCVPFFDPVCTTNGLAFSPDGQTRYFSDSGPSVRRVFSAEYDSEEGTPGATQVFFDTREVMGRPDGGTVDRIVEMPVKKPSKPMFGGSRLDILFVTSIGRDADPGTDAGSLFAITGLGVSGVPQARFAG